MVDGEQRLPDDVLQIVCMLAARQDRYAAYSLALVSHKTCQWTARERWRTVVIRSARQLVCFWKAIYAVPDAIYLAFLEQMKLTRDRAASEQQQEPLPIPTLPKVKLDKVENRRAEGISYPADGKPHRHVKNLFIDLSSDHAKGQLPGVKVLQHSCLVFMATDTFMHTSALADPRSILHRWASYKDRSALDVVSLGIDESDSINWSALQDIHVRELTIIVRADHSADLHVDMPPCIGRLHVVGIDPESELTGVEPPWKLFKSLKSPIATDSLSPVPSLTHRRLTHLRYDTRSFSLRPVEIMALRLRPLLQECTIPPLPTYGAGSGSDTSNVTASFQFEGPRHAAPVRGAGSYIRGLQRSRLAPVAQLTEHDAAARYLNSIGVGCMDLLHFAWERKSPAVVATEVPSVPWYKRTDERQRQSSSPAQAQPSRFDPGVDDETGGWPREMRGAWAEQGERSTATKSKFAVELRDAINTLYGWHAPDIEAAGRFCAARDRHGTVAATTRNTAFAPDSSGVLIEHIQSGMNAVDKDELRAYALLLQRQVPEWRASLDDDQVDGEESNVVSHRTLRMGVRAPRSLLHLGGHAAFTESDRLRLFEDRAGGGRGPWP